LIDVVINADDEAIKFVKAEKAVYEAVLLRSFGSTAACLPDTGSIDELTENDQQRTVTEMMGSFERMARFLEQHQKPELARHYACKV